MCFSSILVLALLLCGYLCFKDDTLNTETVLLGEVNHLFFLFKNSNNNKFMAAFSTETAITMIHGLILVIIFNKKKI